jgi:hypothetical protein
MAILSRALTASGVMVDEHMEARSRISSGAPEGRSRGDDWDVATDWPPVVLLAEDMVVEFADTPYLDIWQSSVAVINFFASSLVHS